MKNLIFTLAIVITLVVTSNAQSVYPVDSEKKADLKLFMVSNVNQADLCIYDVKNEIFTDINSGKWYFINNENLAEKKVYFVDSEKKADIKIYFVNNENQAGWKNKSKDYLMR